METIAYTIGGSTTEVSLNALGAGPHLKFNFSTHGESKCTLDLAGLPPEIAPAIPFEAPCVLRTGRSGSGGSWSGGSILFQGRRTDNSGQASASGASQELVIEDAWYDLRFITYQCTWQNIIGFISTTPTYGTPFAWPDGVLFQPAPNGQLQPNGHYAAYSPAPVGGHITTGQTIAEILAYAIYYGGVNLQIGQIDPACYVPFYPVRSMRCADALNACLRVHPDCACEIDYSTTPPTFNLRQRAHLTSVTLPYKQKTGNQTHLSSKPHPRPDLIPSRVGVYIKSTTTVNGNQVLSVGTDIYPPTLPSGLRSMDVSIDMTGPKLAKTLATLTSAVFDPTDLNWWTQKVPALRPLSAGGQVPNTGGTGALALLNTGINTGAARCIQATDDAGNPINLSTYPNELLTGTPCSWMTSGGVQINVIEATVTGYFSYNKQTTAGTTTIVDQVAEHMHTVRIKLTNSPPPSATYALNQILATGEQYPPGLAQSIYTSLATLQYDFSHTILESPFATVIKPGKHCLNLTGGSAAWTNMNAMVQSVELDLMFTPGSNVTTAKTTVSCGPVKHLEAGELVQLFNLFTNRDLSKINPGERSGGMDVSGGQVTLGSDSPKENSVPANSVDAVKNLASADTTQSGLTNVIAHDATLGMITRRQTPTAGGSDYTAGLVAAEYSGSGAPSSSTLATGAYYRVGERWFDTTAKAIYRCNTAGDKTSSAWDQVSGGGGGSVGKYSFISDGGDYVVALASSAAATTALSTGFSSGSVTSVTVATVTGIAVGQLMKGTGVPAAGVSVTAVNTGTKVVSVSFTASASSTGNYTFTNVVNIAKPPKLRCSIGSETAIDGTGTHSYSYTAVSVSGVTVAYTRTNSWGSGLTQTERITPAYLVGDAVYAVTIPSENVPVSPGSGTTVAVTLLDVHEHDWAA